MPNSKNQTFKEYITQFDEKYKCGGDLTLTKTLFGAYRDGQDGSFSIVMYNTLEEALKYLGVKNEDELESPYDDGAIIREEVTFILEGYDLSLKEPLHISIDT